MRKLAFTLLFFLIAISLQNCLNQNEILVSVYQDDPEYPIQKVLTINGDTLTFDLNEEYGFPRSWLNEDNIEGYINNRNVVIPLDSITSLVIEEPDLKETIVGTSLIVIILVSFIILMAQG